MLEFPATMIAEHRAKDDVIFNYSNSDTPDLIVPDSTIEYPGLGTESITVKAFIRRVLRFADDETIILPQIDTYRRRLVFKRIQDEDELVIDGNEYELHCEEHPDKGYIWWVE
jgi:hypothetical protein